MARGGFHGGGFHSGGHHGGGFHGGGFHGGGFHGGGFGSSFGGGFRSGYYGDSYNGGGYNDGSEEGMGEANFAIKNMLLLVVIGLAFAAEVGVGHIPGMDLINLTMFIVAMLFFLLGIREFKRTAGVYRLRKAAGPIQVQVWNSDNRNWIPSFSISDKVSWAGKYDKKYRIAFYDQDFGMENVIKVRELMKRTPKIVWMNSFVWLAIGTIGTIGNFFFYELVIPVFENMIMTDIAFTFIDHFVFYLPAAITMLSAIACYVIMKVKDKLLHDCAVRIIEDNNAAYEKMKTEDFIASSLSKRWYHNKCPNCGAGAVKDKRSCTHCGTSLEVEDIDKEPVYSVHRISADAERFAQGVGDDK